MVRPRLRIRTERFRSRLLSAPLPRARPRAHPAFLPRGVGFSSCSLIRVPDGPGRRGLRFARRPPSRRRQE